jgi:type III pantothenate kinase
MRLELDAGNTRIKWRVRDHRGIFQSGVDIRSALEENPRWLELIEQVWVSSVHEEQNQWIKETFPQAQFAVTDITRCGLSNSYEDVHKMGVDRWLAMLAAWSGEQDSPHIVIDAGTAITLDIIDEFGRHVGGYICPGFNLMKNTLLGGTDKVLADEGWIMGRAPGNSTQQCVDHGIQDMVACWVERHRELQPNAKTWVTGGDGEKLVTLLNAPVVYEPDLVLDGLAVSFQK